MSVKLRIGKDNPNIVFVGEPASIVGRLFPRASSYSWVLKRPGCTTFGFPPNNRWVYDHGLPSNETTPLTDVHVEYNFFDAAFINISGVTDNLHMRMNLRDGLDLVQMGGVVVLTMSEAQFAELDTLVALRLKDPVLLVDGDKFTVVGHKKLGRGIDRQAIDEMHARLAPVPPEYSHALYTPPFEYLPREIFIEGTQAGFPAKWRSHYPMPEFLNTGSTDSDPLSLFTSEDIPEDGILPQVPLTPSLAGIAKFIASGRFADLSVGPEGEVVYVRGFAKRSEHRMTETVDGEEVEVITTKPHSEIWGLVMDAPQGASIEVGDYVMTRF